MRRELVRKDRESIRKKVGGAKEGTESRTRKECGVDRRSNEKKRDRMASDDTKRIER